ncbi:uncharacterized protein LOC119169685 isoform X3 [Rhipicephalus microplus]|uniref:uncharacterized protein LOC119169685 isoform X3 n=1 Tax=Rhipicephalus microplus TaxID=6941 RepID=UPI003F6CEAF8
MPPDHMTQCPMAIQWVCVTALKIIVIMIRKKIVAHHACHPKVSRMTAKSRLLNVAPLSLALLCFSHRASSFKDWYFGVEKVPDFRMMAVKPLASVHDSILYTCSAASSDPQPLNIRFLINFRNLTDFCRDGLKCKAPPITRSRFNVVRGPLVIYDSQLQPVPGGHGVRQLLPPVLRPSPDRPVVRVPAPVHAVRSALSVQAPGVSVQATARVQARRLPAPGRARLPLRTGYLLLHAAGHLRQACLRLPGGPLGGERDVPGGRGYRAEGHAGHPHVDRDRLHRIHVTRLHPAARPAAGGRRRQPVAILAQLHQMIDVAHFHLHRRRHVFEARSLAAPATI